MARLPNVPDRTPSSDDAQLLGEEGASSTRKQYASTRDMERDDTDTGAMGQAESREARQQRSRAIREASRQATNPNAARPGKLQRLSGQQHPGTNGRRVLSQNKLSNLRTFDVPSDDEDDLTSRRTRRPIGSGPLSPLKRDARRLREEQEQIDRQFIIEDAAGEQVGTGTESGRRSQEYSEGTQEDGSNDVASDPDAHYRDHFPDRVLRNAGHAQAEDGLFVSGSSPAPGSNENVEIAVNGPENNPNVHEDSAPDQQQTSRGSKRKRELPSEAPKWNTQARPSTQPDLNDQGRRKRGRPKKSANTAGAGSAPTTRVADTATRRSPRKTAKQSSAPSTPQKSVNYTVNQIATETHRSTPLATEQPATNGTNHPDAPAPQPARQEKQSSVRSQTAINGNDRSSHPHVRINSDEDLTGIDKSQIARPDAEDAPADDADHQGQQQDGNRSDVEEEEEDQEYDTDDIGYDDNAAEEPEPKDRHRLHGHWSKIHAMWHEVARHRGSTMRIKDDVFKKAVKDCNELRDRVRGITADVSDAELQQTMNTSVDIISQARRICGDETDHRKKRRGFHVYRHLIPALARLFRAVVEAFERVDTEASATQQITLEHLSVLLDLLRAITECEHSAYSNYQGLNKPIKRDVHSRIAIPLRELLIALEKEHRKLYADEERRERNEMLAQDFAAAEEERIERAQRKALETRNQEKWKSMNNLRLYISRNTGLLWKMNHLRSCPMTLVETAADGRPFLPESLRARTGHWSIGERQALISSLRRNANVPDPLRSMVFENVMKEECHHGRPLADKNLLEIILMANEQMGKRTERCAKMGTELEEWIERIPNWMEVVRFGRVAPPPNEDDLEFA